MTLGFSRKKQRGGASTWVFVGFAAVALFFLVTEHRAHLYAESGKKLDTATPPAAHYHH